MKEKIFLTLKIIGLLFLTLGIYANVKQNWIVSVGASFIYYAIGQYILEEYYGESTPATIAAFIGTAIAAIVRVAFNDVSGIIFYVMASILNAGFCSLMSIDFVNKTYNDHDRRTLQRRVINLNAYANERRGLQKNNMFFAVVNMLIFGICALVGCFKPWASFLPFAWLVIRVLYVWLRSRIF